MSDLFWALVLGALGVVWTEINEWLPWLAKKIMRIAVRSLPESARERYAEEWAAVLEDVPGKLLPFFTACGFWWTASRTRIKQVIALQTNEFAFRLNDLLVAVSFFFFFGWLYALIAACVKFSLGGPALYWVPRVGKGGRVFKSYKFRTMVPDSDAVLSRHLQANEAARHEWVEYQQLENDPRFTRFGMMLRRLGLDEVPIFFNVLKGDVSIVGPRPCAQQWEKFYGEDWKHYCSVRPGVVSLWQVSRRHPFNWAERVRLDVEYAKTRSVRLNFVILVKTIALWSRGNSDGQE